MKAKKIINRKCVVTRKIYPKDNLLRVVRLPNGDIVFDEKQNKLVVLKVGGKYEEKKSNS